MIELYGMGSPDVVKIYIALEELGLPYTVHPVDVFTGKQFDPGILEAQSDGQGAGHHRQRRTRGKTLHAVLVGRHPALSRREDRKTAAQGDGREIRGDRVDDGADDHARPDVRAARAFHALCSEGQRLRAEPLHHPGAPRRFSRYTTSLSASSHGSAAQYRHRRHRVLSVGAQHSHAAQVARLPFNARSFQDSNLPERTTFNYRVVAFDARGETPSNIVEITTGSVVVTTGRPANV